MVGKVGTGLDDTTRSFLKNRLMREHGFLKGDIVPEWIHEGYTSNDLPTNFVHKDNFQVVEVVFCIVRSSTSIACEGGRKYSLSKFQNSEFSVHIHELAETMHFCLFQTCNRLTIFIF